MKPRSHVLQAPGTNCPVSPIQYACVLSPVWYVSAGSLPEPEGSVESIPGRWDGSVPFVRIKARLPLCCREFHRTLLDDKARRASEAHFQGIPD